MCLMYGVCRCILLKQQLLTSVSAVLSQIIEPTLQLTLKWDLVVEGWDIAYFALLYFCYYYFIAWQSILQCSFMQPLWKINVSTIHMLFLCSFTHMNNLWHHNISIRLIVCMFVLCIAYVCLSLCCSSDLPWHVKIATPTALSATAFRPGICRSLAQLLLG